MPESLTRDLTREMLRILNFFLAAQLAALNRSSPFFQELSPLILAGAALVLLGLICDAIIIARFLPTPQFQVTPKPWGFRELGYAVIIFAGLFLLSNGIYSAIAIARHEDITTLVPLIIPVEFVLRLGLLWGFVIFFRYRRLDLRQALGLENRRLAPAIGWGLAFALAILPPVGVIIFASDTFCRLVHIPVTEQPIVDFLLKTHSTPLLALLVVFAVVVAPIFEELFFRGFAYPVLKQRFGLIGALIIVSAVFAINHLHGPSLLPLFVLALGLGLVYELTGSLLASITMHAVFNGIMILQVFYQRAHA